MPHWTRNPTIGEGRMPINNPRAWLRVSSSRRDKVEVGGLTIRDVLTGEAAKFVEGLRGAPVVVGVDLASGPSITVRGRFVPRDEPGGLNPSAVVVDELGAVLRDSAQGLIRPTPVYGRPAWQVVDADAERAAVLVRADIDAGRLDGLDHTAIRDALARYGCPCDECARRRDELARIAEHRRRLDVLSRISGGRGIAEPVPVRAHGNAPELAERPGPTGVAPSS